MRATRLEWHKTKCCLSLENIWELLFFTFQSDSHLLNNLFSQSSWMQYWRGQVNQYVEDPPLSIKFNSLAHCRTVSALSFFYRYYNCYDEFGLIITPKASFLRNTQFPKVQHTVAVKLDTNRTNVFANSFIPMTTRDWNLLTGTFDSN